jgi:hypothetical protein
MKRALGGIEMNKTVLFAVALSVAGCLVANAAPVPSVNVVGYITTTNAANTWYMQGGPFAKIGEGANDVTIKDVLGTNIANGTVVYLWNGLYVPENFSGGAWSPGTNLISRADGFWMRSTLGFNLTRVGEVPSDLYASNTVTVVAPGLQILAYPYPVSVALTNMGFDAVAANGDTIYKWNGLGWDTVSFSGGTWATNYVFAAGEGFWYKRSNSSTATNWTVVKPYSLQ